VTSSLPALRSVFPGEVRDPYAELLRDTRALRKDHAQLREAWFAELASERKEDLFFELEILLKALGTFANPRNFAGPPRRAPVVAQDFRGPLSIVRDGLSRIVALCRALEPAKDRAFVFQRYLATVLPDDRARARLLIESMPQQTPAQALLQLRHAMTNLQEVAAGLRRLPRVPYRLFCALLGAAQREVAHSTFFNPLSALEFRPEFDRIQHPRILELMRSVPQESARRLTALTFLSLFRMLRYLSLVEAASRDAHEPSRRAGVVHLVLSVLRSDARALTGQLRHRAGAQLGEAYETELFRVPASELRHRYDHLLQQGHRLVELRATLEGIGSNVRLEMRRAFEHELPAPDAGTAPEDLRAAVAATVRTLRPALQNAILFLGRTLGARLDEQGVFDDAAAKRSLSERLRRDVWMFAQIVRAFAEKARAATSAAEVRWSGVPPLAFVREFLAYFRAMGYPLLRSADYPRFDAFMAAMASLEETDLLDPARLERAIGECEQFHAFLVDLFDRIGLREELAETPFDRKAAARALKMYLGAS
jgi:hypothetical protein